MASISREPGGRRVVQFVGRDGKRRSLRLGKCDQRTAEAVRTKVEALNAAAISGHAPADEVSRWLAGLDQQLTNKLAAVGLIPQRKSTTLGAFLAGYFDARIDVKPTTLGTWRQVGDSLIAFFGADKSLRSIDPGSAEDYRLCLVAAGLSSTTIQKRVQQAREFFSAAQRRGLISSNPFAGIKLRSLPDPARSRFVTREETQRGLDACPDHEWRLIVALARYGGLRTPSETLSLRWRDIDLEHNRISVQSPKGERHGKGVRLLPLFPELLPFFTEAFEKAPEGAFYVIHYNRKTKGGRIDGKAYNYRQRFEKIVRRAGLEPWPRLFQSLRASRETELAAEHPIHVVTAWIGNTPQIALRHYLMPTEEDFAKAVQNPVQYTSEMGGKARESKREIAVFAEKYDGVQSITNPPNGSEWESNPPRTLASPTLVLKTRGTTRRQSPPTGHCSNDPVVA